MSTMPMPFAPPRALRRADDVGGFHFLAVHGGRDALLKGQGDVGGDVRSLLRGDGEDQHVVVVRSERGILKLKTLVGDVPEVPVAAVALGMVKRKIDALGLAVSDLVLAGLHRPDVGHAPGGDDLDVRSEGLDAELEADLVVAFAGRAVADGDGIFLAGDLDQLLHDGRAGHGGAEQVFIFIDGAGLHAGHDEILREIVADVFNI